MQLCSRHTKGSCLGDPSRTAIQSGSFHWVYSIESGAATGFSTVLSVWRMRLRTSAGLGGSLSTPYVSAINVSFVMNVRTARDQFIHTGEKWEIENGWHRWGMNFVG